MTSIIATLQNVCDYFAPKHTHAYVHINVYFRPINTLMQACVSAAVLQCQVTATLHLRLSCTMRGFDIMLSVGPL